ncbi:hypothetical protein ACFWVU_10665 [Streptomyces sp. NPDC058686]|uniref:hypothetical protein n=1 Tax=Streptomyces sp. NPDC058686 TaxID=3346599 RepID=UPI00365D6252
MTENEMRDLLLELNHSRSHPSGVGPRGYVKRMEREAEILHILADESGSFLIYAMAKTADIWADSARGVASELGVKLNR